MNVLYISPAAKSDLEEIKQYISDELNNPHGSLKIVSDILRRIRMLQEFSEIGTLLSSRINVENPYRFLVCGKYLAFYRAEKNRGLWTEFSMAGGITSKYFFLIFLIHDMKDFLPLVVCITFNIYCTQHKRIKR